jgi:hypothetical protein
MAYVPGCQYDLFISYAGENNRNRWVELLKDALIDELEQLLGRQFSRESVFFDKTELRVGQSFPETLEKAAEASALLLPVLSPSYLSSDWCDRERRAFFQSLPDGTIEAECLVPIVVRRIEQSELTTLFRSAQHVSFLQPSRLDPWPAGSSEWTAALKQFAAQLMAALQNLRRKCKPVFLGRALGDMEDLRNLCAVELQKRHFRVVPETIQVLDEERALIQTLQQSALSVHFLGGATDAALAAIEIAAGVSSGAIILHRPFGRSLTAEEELWLTDFERGLKPTQAAKYQRLEGKNEQELFAVLEAEIARIRPPASNSLKNAAIGLICDEPDLDLVRHLRHEIEIREQCPVLYPDFLECSGTSMERRRKWTELVKKSEALLFYWGRTQETTLLDTLDRLASGSSNVTRREWYLSPPDLDLKQQKFPGAICQMGEFDYEALTCFLEPLRSHRRDTP